MGTFRIWKCCCCHQCCPCCFGFESDHIACVRYIVLVLVLCSWNVMCKIRYVCILQCYKPMHCHNKSSSHVAESINKSSVDVVFERHGKRGAVDLRLGIGIVVIVVAASGNIDPYQIGRILMGAQVRMAIPVPVPVPMTTW